MMTAEQIAARLDGKREGRTTWRCYCPKHHGHSLIISETGQKVLFRCFGGCSQDDILDYLKSRGLWDNSQASYRPSYQSQRYQSTVVAAPRTDDKILSIYHDANGPRARVSAYLAKRGITIAPLVLRFGFVWHKESNARLPAMVAPIEHTQQGLIGVHVTWLSNDDRKADIETNRKIFAHAKGGAVRLADPIKDEWFVLGEGIENTLSAMMLSGFPGWSAVSQGGIKSVILPASINKVMIAGDNDSNGVGQRAVREAANRFTAEGRLVKVVLPPEPDIDWNKLLMDERVGQ